MIFRKKWSVAVLQYWLLDFSSMLETVKTVLHTWYTLHRKLNYYPFFHPPLHPLRNYVRLLSCHQEEAVRRCHRSRRAHACDISGAIIFKSARGENKPLYPRWSSRAFFHLLETEEISYFKWINIFLFLHIHNIHKKKFGYSQALHLRADVWYFGRRANTRKSFRTLPMIYFSL